MLFLVESQYIPFGVYKEGGGLFKGDGTRMVHQPLIECGLLGIILLQPLPAGLFLQVLNMHGGESKVSHILVAIWSVQL